MNLTAMANSATERAFFNEAHAIETRERLKREGRIPREYTKLVKEFGSKLAPFEKKKENVARIYVPKMWNLLYHKHKIEWIDARRIVEIDAMETGGWGHWSVVKFLPDEAKQQDKRPGGFASAKAKQERGLAVADDETRRRVSEKGGNSHSSEHMSDIGQKSGGLRSRVAELERELQKEREEKGNIVELPHKFSIAGEVLETIKEQINEGVDRLYLELVSYGTIRALSQPKRIKIKVPGRTVNYRNR